MAETAPDWPALWALQANLAATQWSHAMDSLSGLVEQAMRIENHLVERSRAQGMRLSQCWMADQKGHVAGDPAASQSVEANPPLAMLNPALARMNEMSRLWTHTFYNTNLPD